MSKKSLSKSLPARRRELTLERQTLRRLVLADTDLDKVAGGTRSRTTVTLDLTLTG